MTTNDWAGARWIGMDHARRGRAAPMFRLSFEVDGDIAAATLRICGLGYYEAWCNGGRVGDHVLDPAQTDYEQRAFYVDHHVTDLLRTGGNALGVILGDGWYKQDRVWEDIDTVYGQPCLIATLTIQLADGSTQCIVTDQSWRCAIGPITEANVYAGECYDARLERPGWSTADHDDGDWQPVTMVAGPGGRLEPQPMEPMRCVEQLMPVSITQCDAGRFVVDMGQNFAGWARLRIEAEAGKTITMRFAEAIDEQGRIDTASTGVFATHVEQIDRYTCKGGGMEQWEPRFTYHGFRYVEVTGPRKLEPGDITGIVVHTDLPTVGRFECSDTRLNQLHTMALWTHRGNIHGLPEDCPSRERCGWLGDANVVAEMSLWNYAGRRFWAKYLDDIETTRANCDGLPAMIAPGRRLFPPASPDWAAAFIMLPWYLHLHTGDVDILARHYDGTRRLIEHFHDKTDGWLLGDGLGDWFDPGGENIVDSTDPLLTTSLWFMRCAQVMSRTAALLGRDADASRYADWPEPIADAVRGKWYDPDAGSFGSQTADAMALAFDVAPRGDDQRVAAAIARDVEQRDDHLNVGIMGTRFVLETLTRYGHGQVALRALHNDSYPGFGDLINQGATTLWEWWGERSDRWMSRPRSMNHPMFAGYDNWFYNTLAGIQIDEDHPGFERFTVRPHIVPGIDWVEAHHDSVRGRIAVRWARQGNLIAWRVQVPEDSRALVVLPDGQEKPLGPGVCEGVVGV